MSNSAKYLRPEVLGKIARLELRARAVVEGFINGLHKSPYHGFSVEFAEHREYVPGDDVRHIDWRVFAKSDRFYIKQYEEETNLRCVLLLDGSGSMAYPEHHGSEGMTKWDYACTVAASIAFLQSQQQDAVGLVLFDHDIRQQLPGATTARQLNRMIQMIAAHQPDGDTDLKPVFGRLAERLPRRSMVVLISDLLADVDNVIDGLHRLRHTRHEVLLLHVLDEDELHFPFADQTLFEGMEQPLELLTDPQALRQSYLEGVERFIARIRSFCVDHRIDYALLSTHDPLDVALSTFLARRMHAIRAMSV